MNILSFKKVVDLNKNTININVINKELNYVAIGDSIAAGFNSKFGFQSCGYKDDELNKIIGFSYPSYFARMINELKPNFVNQFNNFSFSNITAKQYLDLLSRQEDISHSTKTLFKFINALNKEDTNPFKNEYSDEFKDFNYQNHDFDYMYTQISKANLITVSLGANDFIKLLPLKTLIKYSNEKNVSIKRDLLIQLHQELNFVSEKIKKYLKGVYIGLRNLNNNSNIVFLGYQKTLIHFESLINSLFNTEDIVDEEISNILIGYLNLSIKTVANENNCQYIDINDTEFIEIHKDQLYENIFDIHPTEKGQKFIAQILANKLLINRDFIHDSYKNTNNRILTLLPSLKVFLKDNLSYNKTIDLGQSDMSILVSLFGLSRGDRLFLDDSVEIEYKHLFVPDFKISWALSHMDSIMNIDVSRFIKLWIQTKFHDENYEYESKKLIIEYLNNRDWSKQIIKHLLTGDGVNELIKTYEHQIIKTRRYGKEIDIRSMLDAKNMLLVDQKLIYSVVKLVFNTPFIISTKEQLNNILYAFLREILTKPLLETLIGHKLDEKMIRIREYVSELDSFKEFVEFLLTNLIINTKKFIELDSFDEMFKRWISLNYYKLIYYFDSILFEITKTENEKKTLNLIVSTILLSNKLTNITEEEMEELNKKVESLLWLSKLHKVRLNAMFILFMKEMKKIKPYELIFNPRSKKRRKWYAFNLARKLKYLNILKKFTLTSMQINRLIKKIKAKQKGE
ncbi:SGNH/GDSL hydrolase family protein [Mycoplasma phocoenae]|uniref:SGNH/GDSL hydrolase family protein n=1 Tax=Mycoplasma phocoenae TaxID=754517 RepID=A0A858U4R4_9MOLU|nr:SGNH/GDSL hydrolase family protein [Mycoplasma phocoenae]QJG67069.1 SGNH/GDSL hydrolase family protein [Mycoplasma phocoenae]